MSPKPISLFARTIRGIESIAVSENEQRCGAAITEIRHREIRFQLDSLRPGLLDLGSVDDVFLTCGLISEVDHTRAALAGLAKRSNRINFVETVAPLNTSGKFLINQTSTLSRVFWDGGTTTVLKSKIQSLKSFNVRHVGVIRRNENTSPILIYLSGSI